MAFNRLIHMYITWNIAVVIEPVNFECYTRTN